MTEPKAAAAAADLNRRAEDLARALAAAHRGNQRVTETMRAFVSLHPNLGPLQRKTFIDRCSGVEGELGKIHLDITPFDPRPQKMDGGGNK
jgi:hypothetical protein